MNPLYFEFENINDNVFAKITLNAEGKFNPALLKAFNESLDKTLENVETKCLIITGKEKNFSQGLDLQSMSEMTSGAEATQFVNDCVEASIERLLLFPIPVVCAINGHAFGLGAMMALAADYRIMREDRGFFCLPESTININLTPSMNALVTHKLHGQNLRDILLTGMHMGGIEAAERGIVDASCSEERLLDIAKSIAIPMIGKERKIISELKMGINQDILPRNFL